MLLNLLISLQELPKIPKVEGISAVYVWIISILILALVGLVAMYERKLTNINDRLNKVIDDSIERMESKSISKETALQRMNDMLLQLKEILVLAGRKHNER